MYEASSSMPDTVQQVSYHETCCQTGPGKRARERSRMNPGASRFGTSRILTTPMTVDRLDNRTRVQLSELGAQPIGEVAEVVYGIYQLKVPVPIPLGFVSVYLIDGPD